MSLKQKEVSRWKSYRYQLPIYGYDAAFAYSLIKAGFKQVNTLVNDHPEPAIQFGIDDYTIRIIFDFGKLGWSFCIYKEYKTYIWYCLYKREINCGFFDSEKDVRLMLEVIGKYTDKKIPFVSTELFYIACSDASRTERTISQYQHKTRSKPYCMMFETKYEEELKVKQVKKKKDFACINKPVPESFRYAILDSSKLLSATNSKEVREEFDHHTKFNRIFMHEGRVLAEAWIVEGDSLLKDFIITFTYVDRRLNPSAESEYATLKPIKKKRTKLNPELKVRKGNARQRSKLLLTKELESYRANQWFYNYLSNDYDNSN